MTDTAKWIYSKLSSDATLRATMGGSAADTRVHWRKPNIRSLLSSGKPGLITFFEVGTAGDALFDDYNYSVQDESWQIDAWALDKITLESMADRIDRLFNKASMTAQTTFQAFLVERTFKGDIADEDPEIYHKAMRFRINGIVSLSELT